MGLLSEIRDHYSTLDHSLKKKERHVLSRAADIIVPKRDRKDAKDLVSFLDRFAGMIATDAPNTDVAPRMSHLAAEPFFAAKKKPSPWNVYAAAMSLPIFPRGTLSKTGPEKWKARWAEGTVINRQADQEDSPSYHFYPPGADESRPSNTYADVSMQSPQSSYIGWLGRDLSHPGNSIFDLIDPLTNRYEQHGAQINAGPINVGVAGTLLNYNRSHPGSIGPGTLAASRRLGGEYFDLLNEVAKAVQEGRPQDAGWKAEEIRGKITANHHTPREFQGALLAFLRDKETSRLERGEHGPEISAAQRAPDWLKRGKKGNEYDQLLDMVMNNRDVWRERSSGISVPGRHGLDIQGGRIGASFGEPQSVGRQSLSADASGQVRVTPFAAAADRVRARFMPGEFEALSLPQRENLIREEMAGHTRHPDLSTPLSGSHLDDALAEAERQHQPWEWDAMAENDRRAAAQRASNGFPANVLEMDSLRRDAEEWWNRRNAGDPFSSYAGDSRNAIIRQFQNEQFSGGSLDRATDAVMGAIFPHETLSDLGLDTGVNTRPSLTEITRRGEEAGTRLQGSFEDFVSQREAAARHAQAGVGDAEWRRMSPEERDSLIRAQMAQNRRSAEHSRAQSHMQALAERADELHRSGIELDITERAVLAASRNPEWNLMSEQERQAETRRERRRIAHESER